MLIEHEATANAITASVQGLKTRDEAISEGVLKLTQAGITTIDYKSGVQNQTDVAIRRHSVTQVSQAGGDMTKARLEACNHTLVLTSAHYGARPSHAAWQGRPCSLKAGGEEKTAWTTPAFTRLQDRDGQTKAASAD